MSGTYVRGRLLALVVLSSACATDTAQQTPADTAADEAAIRELVSQELAAIGSSNPAGYTALITTDFEAMPPNEPAVVGPDAVTTWMNNFFSAVTAQGQYSNEEISVHDDVAVHRYSGQLTVTPKDGSAPPTTETIKGLHIFQRQSDGTWKMTHDVWNSDTPAAHAPTTTTAN